MRKNFVSIIGAKKSPVSWLGGMNESVSSGKSRTRHTGNILKMALLSLTLSLAFSLAVAEDTVQTRGSQIQNAAGTGGISTPGMVESRSGGFKFPDGSIQATASDLTAHTADAGAHHSRYNNTEAVAAIKAADGTGSTLDADLLDGMHASEVIDAAINAVRTPIDSLPYTINQPGSYYITGNLDGSGGGINISADDVTLDLMGFALDGGGVNDKGIDIQSIRDNVTIRNGTVTNFGQLGIVQSYSAGGTTSSNTRILNMRVIDNGALAVYHAGISINATNALVSGCTVSGHPGNGISVSATGIVRNNLTYGNGRAGIFGGGLIVGNVVNNNGGGGSATYSGIDASHAIIRDNVVKDNQYSGISGGTLLVERNVVESNNLLDDVNEAGIHAQGDSRVAGNTLSANKQNGILVSGRGNAIIDNHITATNPGNGIKFSISGNYYRDNTARGNATDFNLGAYTITDGGGNVGF
jgi:hypothetical protein